MFEFYNKGAYNAKWTRAVLDALGEKSTYKTPSSKATSLAVAGIITAGVGSAIIGTLFDEFAVDKISEKMEEI